MFPGEAKKLSIKAKRFDFEHSITKYRIFVTVQKIALPKPYAVKWFSEREAEEQNPSSLIKKVFNFGS